MTTAETNSEAPRITRGQPIPRLTPSTASPDGSRTLSPAGRPIGRRYVEEIFDRKTGELVSVDKGDWITIGELAEVLDHGRRRTTTVLRQLNFLHVEGGGRDNRHRICDWVVQMGWGKRLHRKVDKRPFDVISPEAVAWVSERWQGAIDELELKARGPIAEAREALEHFETSKGRKKMTAEMQAFWLADFFPHFTQDQVAESLEVSRQLVGRFMSLRSAQIRKARKLKGMFRMRPENTCCVNVA